MVAAVGYQESRLDQSQRSSAGAVGVMQVLPSTAGDPNVAIEDIHSLDGNVHAGVKYLRFLHDRYFTAEELAELDRWLFTFAAYNAGPARVAGLRRSAEDRDLDPDQWFRHVELVAADRIGRETVEICPQRLSLLHRLWADRGAPGLQGRRAGGSAQRRRPVAPLTSSRACLGSLHSRRPRA